MIDAKYNEMKLDIEKSRLTTMTSDVTAVVEKPTPIPTNTLFSMKKFALTKSTNSNVQLVGDDTQGDLSQLMELNVQNTSLDPTKYGVELSSSSSYVVANINDNSMMSYNFSSIIYIRNQQHFFYVDNFLPNHDLANLDLATPSINNILSCNKETSIFEQGIKRYCTMYYIIASFFSDKSSNNLSPVQCNGNESHSETATDDESEESESENDVVLTPLPTQNIRNITPTRSLIMFKHIEGVKFITNQELNFIDTQREKHPSIQWFTENKQKQVKPSRHWFSTDHSWLRAVCSNHRYGLLCVDCAEFGTDKTLIERNNGAFVVRPYWKLKHKGLQGLIRICFKEKII